MKFEASAEFGFASILVAAVTALIGTTLIANAISGEDEEQVEVVRTNTKDIPVCKCNQRQLPHIHV